MKLVSWNVNGIRACLGHGLKESVLSLNPDVLFLQETKLSDDSSFPLAIEGMEHVYFTISKVKKGYSGVAFLSKIKPISVHYGLEGGAYDEEGRVITLEFPSFYLVGAYVPNSGEELKRLPFRLEYEKRLVSYLDGLKTKKPVVYTGDMNVAHEEIDIKNPASNHHNAGFTDEDLFLVELPFQGARKEFRMEDRLLPCERGFPRQGKRQQDSHRDHGIGPLPHRIGFGSMKKHPTGAFSWLEVR